MTKISNKDWSLVRAIPVSDRTMRRAAQAWLREKNAEWTQPGYVTYCLGENMETALYWWSSNPTTAKRIANTHYMKNKGRDIFYYAIGEVGNGEFKGIIAQSGQ